MIPPRAKWRRRFEWLSLGESPTYLAQVKVFRDKLSGDVKLAEFRREGRRPAAQIYIPQDEISHIIMLLTIANNETASRAEEEKKMRERQRVLYSR